jgi:hypothetical protein
MAEEGITEEDLRELIQKLEGVPGAAAWLGPPLTLCLAPVAPSPAFFFEKAAAISSSRSIPQSVRRFDRALHYCRGNRAARPS